MKKITYFLAPLFLLMFTFSGCNKIKYGDVTFWQMTGSGFGVTVVEIDGVSSNITSEYPDTPDCGASGCAVFNNLETGSYSYTASDGFDTWSGTVDISEGCLTMELY
ncbi:MAG: hypothetical protein CL853_07565 [Crocinitomicaceae bacterium]|nr:hypothetical protein [Crocinitomicaceae bacterium]|tara:strand:+ start:1548 stop:1868 length:321 start_codon:yes stop_codon:yes gene_type:complete